MDFRILDMRQPDAVPSEVIQRADTPEGAVRLALGEDTSRGGSRRTLVAKVYYGGNSDMPLTMIRLYRARANRH